MQFEKDKRYWLLLYATSPRSLPSGKPRPSIYGQGVNLCKRILEHDGIVAGWSAFTFDVYDHPDEWATEYKLAQRDANHANAILVSYLDDIPKIARKKIEIVTGQVGGALQRKRKMYRRKILKGIATKLLFQGHTLQAVEALLKVHYVTLWKWKHKINLEDIPRVYEQPAIIYPKVAIALKQKLIEERKNQVLIDSEDENVYRDDSDDSDDE